MPEFVISADMHHAWLAYFALGLSMAGVLLALVEFGLPKSTSGGICRKVSFCLQPLFQTLVYRSCLPAFINYVIYRGIANILTQNDKKVIDDSIDSFCDGIVESSRFLSFLHTGMIQYRLIVVFATIFFLSLYFFIG
jgi:NADH-quinone oxidoreductase subunit L